MTVHQLREREESAKQIKDGLAEYNRQQEETRRAFDSKPYTWSDDWGGDCPWRASDPEIEDLRRRAGLTPLPMKKSFIDRAMPYILLAGFFGVIAAAAFVLTMVINYSAGLPLFTAW